MRSFDSLSEREILALAISLEEEDERVYAEYAEGLRATFAASAAVFDGMREEESGHRRRLIELFRQKFGEHIPLIRRQDVRGFVHRKPVWLVQPLGLDTVRNQAAAMEVETDLFCRDLETLLQLLKNETVRHQQSSAGGVSGRGSSQLA